ncbi:MAG: glycosyltransferase family 2 protein [Ignavibacteriales bacterium]|nr:glycosyltransferase family 2 protein [Ignavibacteriales bacterium]
MTCCVIIPFYNEKDFIREVVEISARYCDSIYVIDDGSTDGGAQNIPKIPGVEIFTLERNQGKGAALRLGFIQAIKQGYDTIITIDGDKQHNPEFIPKFMEALVNNPVVIGKRKFDTSIMPFHRILSNSISSFLISLKTGIKVLDSQSGYRGFRCSLLKEILPEENGYIAETEMLIKASKYCDSFAWVDIPTIYGEEKSKMKNIETTLKFVKQIVKPLGDF